MDKANTNVTVMINGDDLENNYAKINQKIPKIKKWVVNNVQKKLILYGNQIQNLNQILQ